MDQPYGYAGDDPVNESDPSGEKLSGCSWWEWGLAAGLCGARQVYVDAVNEVENKVSNLIGEIEAAEPASTTSSDLSLTDSPCLAGAANSDDSSGGGSTASHIGIVGEISKELRLPDYISVEVAGGAYGVVGGAVATLTRYGDVYVGPVAGVGVPGIAGSISAGWIDQLGSVPGRDQLSSFVHGNSIALSGYVPVVFGIAGPDAAEVWGNVGGTSHKDFGTQVGIAVGAGKYVGLEWSYSFNVDHHGPTW